MEVQICTCTSMTAHVHVQYCSHLHMYLTCIELPASRNFYSDLSVQYLSVTCSRTVRHLGR